MYKNKILLIKAGGTVCQKQNQKGHYEISNQDYLNLIPEIFGVAKISEKEISPIDSTNMCLQDRKNIADIIKRNHKEYDGFVIIQGTDTMSDSAIAINYMIQDLGKPIIFTGSQIPIYEKGTDAKKNIIDAINVSTKDIGESAIVFGGKIIRGSRAIKRHTESVDAFYSPKSPLIGEIKENEIYLKNQIPRKLCLVPKIFTDFKKNIIYFNQISGADTNLLEKIVKDCDCSGIIIGGYGTGNINSKYLKAIQLATNAGKPVAITTVCPYGKTAERYIVGADAIDRGAFLTYDMTKEAVCQKMMYALGLAKSKKIPKNNMVDFVKEIIQNPIGKDIKK